MRAARPTLGLLALGCLALAAASARADVPPGDEPPGPFQRIRIVDFPDEIGAVLAAYVGRQLEQAKADGADCLVLRIESPGGTVLHSQKIGDLLIDAPDSLHVIAWIPKEAYSGAAMVALACDEIVMGADAHIGDAQPITVSPEGIEPVGEKIESPLRAKFRAYAEQNGYPVALAEAMVSARIEVIQVRDASGRVHYVKGDDFRAFEPEAEVFPGITRRDLVQVGPPIVREDELLTLTAKEARRYGFLRRTFGAGRGFPESEAELLSTIRAEGAVVEEAVLSMSEEASRVLLQLAGILSAIVAISLLMLLWQGPGVMTIVGGVSLILVILINATADQLHGFPIFLLAVGFLLLAAEVFVIPGFGVAGVLGIVSMGTGFLFLAAGATLGDTSGVTTALAVDFGIQFVVTILLGMAALFTLSRWLPSVGPARRLMLAAPPAAPVSTSDVVGSGVAVGERGVCVSPLRPAGTVEIEGRFVDVVADGSFVPRGAAVRVVLVEGNRVVVRALDEAVSEEEA